MGQAAAVATLGAAVVGFVVLLAASSLAAAASGVGPAGGAAGAGAGTAIPPAMLALYRAAAGACPDLPWTVLAAIGTVESANGTSTLPGVHSGANAAGAEGPMQFEPATFAAYADPVPPGGVDPPSPYDPVDAVWAAARMLCADGAAGGADLPGAIYAYDHDPAYVQEVLSLARAEGGAAEPAGGGAGGAALAWALGQVGTPYLWGGEAPGVGFDCSGLAQAAWAAAGVPLPRVAQAQWDAGPALPAGSALAAGDLVFFGTGRGAVDHVGLYAGVGGGLTGMVDAPHAGAAVRVEPFPDQLGAAWGDEVVVGVTRPGG